MNNFRQRWQKSRRVCPGGGIFFAVTIWLITSATQCASGAASDFTDCASGYGGDESESFASGANDVVVVQQNDGSLKSTTINVQVRTFLIATFYGLNLTHHFH